MLKKNMAETLAELKTFISRPDVPASKVTSLLGRQVPGAMLNGIALRPHDQRFDRISIRFDLRDKSKLQTINFSCPKHPVTMAEVEPIFGSFTTNYNEKRKFTWFVCDNFDDGVIKDFRFRIEGYQLEVDGDKVYVITGEDGKKQEVDKTHIVFGHFSFAMVDRDPVPDPNAGKNTMGGTF